MIKLFFVWTFIKLKIDIFSIELFKRTFQVVCAWSGELVVVVVVVVVVGFVVALQARARCFINFWQALNVT